MAAVAAAAAAIVRYVVLRLFRSVSYSFFFPCLKPFLTEQEYGTEKKGHTTTQTQNNFTTQIASLGGIRGCPRWVATLRVAAQRGHTADTASLREKGSLRSASGSASRGKPLRGEDCFDVAKSVQHRDGSVPTQLVLHFKTEGHVHGWGFTPVIYKSSVLIFATFDRRKEPVDPPTHPGLGKSKKTLWVSIFGNSVMVIPSFCDLLRMHRTPQPPQSLTRGAVPCFPVPASLSTAWGALWILSDLSCVDVDISLSSRLEVPSLMVF